MMDERDQEGEGQGGRGTRSEGGGERRDDEGPSVEGSRSASQTCEGVPCPTAYPWLMELLLWPLRGR